MYEFIEEPKTETLRKRVQRHRENKFEFIAIDGEGAGYGEEHRYVLLGCGDQYIENTKGIFWKEAFGFLYSCFEQHPSAAFVGFFLSYDFTQILKSLPEERARMLLTEEGINARKRTRSGQNRKPFPVRYDGWEFDMLPGRRLQIRPQVCHCHERGKWKCEHKQLPWMYICDSGPFWQTSLLNSIDPRQWTKAVVSPSEFLKIEEGKSKRSMTLEEYIQDRERVIEYMLLENNILSRIMGELREGFEQIGVRLSKAQWFGPGQAAAAWFNKEGFPRRETIESMVPDYYRNAAQSSYFGGWFEVFSHGIIPGKSFEYDINSAYPYIISTLPCLLHGRYSHGNGPDYPQPKPGSNKLVLLRCGVHGNDENIGSMLNRDPDGRIRRPNISVGWYWLHEIEAAQRAGIVAEIKCREWVSYDPCDCPSPGREFRALYDHRLRVGKESILGKSSKLVYNSGYGKCAQSVGASPYGNWVYASLITAGCRVMILDAISSHPDGTDSVLMVATDAVFFDSPHPTLPISTKLGDWSRNIRENLAIFKPGVYWDDDARRAIASGDPVKFKARGVNSRDFSKVLGEVDKQFLKMLDPVPGFKEILFQGEYITAYAETPWPSIEFPVSFNITSIKTALNIKQWGKAGQTQINVMTEQDSYPGDKRQDAYFDPVKNRVRTHPLRIHGYEIVSKPYEKKNGLEDPFSLDTNELRGINYDGTLGSLLQAYARILSRSERV